VEYFVIGADGQEYGPANLDALRVWVQEGRIYPATMLKNAANGQVIPASSVSGLFPNVAPPPTYGSPPAAYPRMGAPVAPANTGSSDVWGAIIRSALALVFFFVFRGLGIIVGGYAVYYAYRGYQKGHPHAMTAIIISVTAFLIICVGWFLRARTMSGPY
jgi:hypothetical protein